MSEPFIYIGHGSNGNVYIYDRGENIIKQLDLISGDGRTFGIINKIKVDTDGCIYLILNYGDNSGYTNGGTVRKYGPNGDLKWMQSYTWACGHLDIDDNGNVYVIGQYTGTGGVKKYNSSGVLQWTGTEGAYSYSAYDQHLIPICAKSDGSLIVVGGLYVNTSSDGLVAYDEDGNVIWNVPEIDGCLAIIIDEDDNDYVYALQINPSRISKVNSSDGSIINEIRLPSNANGVPRAVTKDNNGDFIAAMSQISGNSAYKFDSDLNIIWIGSSTGSNTISGNATYDIDCDADGNIYVINQEIAFGAGLSARDNDGQPLWAITDPANSIRCLTVAYPVSIPPIDLSVYLGTPAWEGDRYVDVPGLLINVSFGLLNTWRDYVGSQKFPSIYRLYLTGTPDLELAISSINCRYDNNTVTLTAVVPAVSISIIESIEDRLDGELVLYRGIRLSDTIEQINEMIRVSFDNLRYDLGSSSGSATLQGSADNAASSNTRTIRGISYRNTINNLRRIRCEVDTYLRPGDTADLGNGETLTVSEIVYSIDTTQAIMEISE